MNTLILDAVASVVDVGFYAYCEYWRKMDDSDSKHKILTFPVKSLYVLLKTLPMNH